MTTRKKKTDLVDIEEQEGDEVVASMVDEDKLALYDEYFAAGLDMDGLAYKKNYYDFILFNSGDHQKYYYGTAAAHALDALKANGYFIFNMNGSALDIDQVIHIFEFVGLTYLEKEGKNGFYVFQKVVN